MTSASLTPALAELVEAITARMERGESVDEARLAAEHPEHAAELNRLLPTIRMLADLSRSRDQVASMPNDVTGTLGDFRIQRLVGRGGMGDVYEAEQISLGRRVALKVLPFAVTLDSRQLQRFQNEARAAASLHHPHIVPVYAVGSDRGVHYFAMQFIDGPSLAECVRDRAASRNLGPADSTAVARQSTWPEAAEEFARTVSRIGKHVADALEHAHSIGIVHRDIKPSNLLLDSRGTIWVADFGLARSRTADLTRSGDLVGTLRYMSPEQALAKHDLVDHRTDIYSLGATLYELLTLRPAVVGDDQAELLRNIAIGEPASPRSIDPTIPMALETVVLKALAKEPSHRYATAAEFADDLGRFLDDRPIQARRPTLGQRIGNWSRRHRALVRASVTSLILILAVSTAVVAFSRARIQSALDSEIAALDRERAGQSQLRVALARLAWSDARIADAREQLDACPDEHRNDEWVELNRLCHAETSSLALPFDPMGLALSHDGRTIALRSSFSQFVTIDLETGRASKIVKVDSTSTDVVFTPGDRQFVSLHLQSALSVLNRKPGAPTASFWRIWDANTLQTVSQWNYVPRAGTQMDRIARRIVSVSNNRIYIWSVRTGKVEAEIEVETTAVVLHLALDRDGDRLAAVVGDEVWVWDAASRKRLLVIPNVVPSTGRIQFTSDGRRLLLLAMINSEDFAKHRLAAWDLETNRLAFEIAQPDSFTSLTSSLDGRHIAWATDRRIELIDGETGRSRATFFGHSLMVRQIAISPDGERLYSVGRDRTARTWDLRPWSKP